MNRHKKRSLITAVTVSCLLGCSLKIQAQTLTDAVLFRLDGSNNAQPEGWNTRGADAISNLYLLSGPSFINSGNAGLATLSINLSVPGVYTFAFAGENVNANVTTQLGLNLFFNNNAATPGISARGLSPSGFVANGNSTFTPLFTAVTGANALTFNGVQQVTLSALSYQTNSAADQVTSFNNVPGGTGDTVGTFTLTVGTASAPEPTTLMLLAFGGLLGGASVRRRKFGSREAIL